MIVVGNVEAASQWFQVVLGLTSGHGGDQYEMLMAGDQLVAQLHHWDAHEHQHLGNEADPLRGNGVLLWFGSKVPRAIELLSQGRETSAPPMTGLGRASLGGA